MLLGPDDFAPFAEKLTAAIQAGEEPCVDTETSGLNPWGTRKKSPDRVIGMSIGIGAGEFYLPCEHAYGENLRPEQVTETLRVLTQAKSFMGFNVKFDAQMLVNRGLVMPRNLRDVMLLMQLLDENHLIGLKPCATRYLGGGAEDQHALDEMLMLWGLQKDEMWRLPASAVAPYACTDVRLPRELARKFESAPGELLDVWDMRNRCLPIVIQMERNGMHVERSVLLALREEAHREMLRIAAQLRPWLGSINPNSADKVAKRLGLPNSQDETLARSGHPAAPLIQKYRGYSVAVSTYYNVYEEYMDSLGLVHADFKMTGTETGRWSCKRPNMQAIPKWDAEQRVKEVFTPRGSGKVMVELDYSQAELRVAAHYTRDPKLVAAIEAGKDLHQATADATGLPRDIAKTLNFSVVYGIGASKLAFELKTTEKEAYRYLQTFHDTYPGFRTMARQAESIARDRGFIKLYNGRRRHFNSRDAETRKAFSNLIQGGVSQMEEQAAIDIAPVVEEAGGLIVNQVHDSFYLELPAENADEIINLCREVMEDQPQFSVPIVVDAKKGTNMKDLTKVERYR